MVLTLHRLGHRHGRRPRAVSLADDLPLTTHHQQVVMTAKTITHARRMPPQTPPAIDPKTILIKPRRHR
jgi:hypothetical protein